MPKNSLRDAVRRHLDSLTTFLVDELDALVEERALALVAERLGLGNDGALRRSARARTKVRVSAGRTPKANGDAAARIVAYVRAHPGTKSEAVRAALKIGKGQWNYNVNKALASQAIKRKGVKRSSTLHPA